MTRSAKKSQIRQLVADEAARLLARDECADYQGARRKAAARLGCRDHRQLPDNREIEAALLAYQRLFSAESQQQVLVALRQLALEAMQHLARFDPRLIGAVASGTATASTPLQLYLFADAPEEVVFYLEEQRIPYQQRTVRLCYAGGVVRNRPLFAFMAGAHGVELTVLPLTERADPPIDPLTGRPGLGLSLSRVRDMAAIQR